MFRDISAHKRTEEELLSRYANSNRWAYFAGGIAHDFNNILASILGYTSLALLDRDTSRLSAAGCKRSKSGEPGARSHPTATHLLQGGEPVKQIASDSGG